MKKIITIFFVCLCSLSVAAQELMVPCFNIDNNYTYLKRLQALLILTNLKSIEAKAENATTNNAQATFREIWEATSSLSRELEVYYVEKYSSDK